MATTCAPGFESPPIWRPSLPCVGVGVWFGRPPSSPPHPDSSAAVASSARPAARHSRSIERLLGMWDRAGLQELLDRRLRDAVPVAAPRWEVGPKTTGTDRAPDR